MRATALAVGTCLAAGALAVGGLWALEQEGQLFAGAGSPDAHPPSVARCAHGVALPDGRALCGAAAQRYVQQQIERQKRLFGLSPASEREARRLARGDPVLRALIGGSRYRIAEIGPWTAAGSRRVIGAGLLIDLARPLSRTAVLPYVCAGDARLPAGRVRVAMRDVSRLMVLVHFARSRILDVMPAPQPGAPPPSVRSAPLPGNPWCPPSSD